MKTILFFLLLFSVHGYSAILQCTTRPQIMPFTGRISDVTGVSGYANPNGQHVQLIAVNGSNEDIVPVGVWEGTDFLFRWVRLYDAGNIVTETIPSEVSEDEYYIRPSVSANWIFQSASLTVTLNRIINAEKLYLKLKKDVTSSSVKKDVPGYTVIPGVASQWDLPDYKDIGEITPGIPLTYSLPAPTGTNGSLRTLETLGGESIISIRSPASELECSENCTLAIQENSPVEIKVYAEPGIPEGEYGLKLEATLLCD
ncbi:MAG TPA: hypothetical protein VGH05_05610 [Buttiauxella sp.]|jgi:hypothetical protein